MPRVIVTDKLPSYTTCRYSGADSRCRRGRKCGEIAPNAARNRCACPTDLNRLIARSRARVGWWDCSARLIKNFDRRCSTEGMISRCATV